MSLIPGALYDPGVHWNYQAGHTLAAMLVWHYTVGSNSIALIRDRGLAPVLIRDDVIWQFAPLDARCFTQCEFNGRAIGYEVESLDGSISDAELGLLGYATVWALTQHGIPPVFYDGPRMAVGTPYVGVTNHRNLMHHACDMHSDGFDRWVWDAIMGAAPPAQEDDNTMLPEYLVKNVDDGQWWHFPPMQAEPVRVSGEFVLARASFMATGESNGPTIIAIQGSRQGALIRLAQIITAAVPPPSGGGAPLPADVATKADIAASEQRVRADVNKARTVQ